MRGVLHGPGHTSLLGPAHAALHGPGQASLHAPGQVAHVEELSEWLYAGGL